MRNHFTLVAYTFAFLSGSFAHAAIISIESNSANSTENLASFTGTLNYGPISATTGTLTVSLTNTSSSGFLVAFAFNNPFDSVTGVTVATATNLDNLLGLPDYQNDINVAPFNVGDIGVSLGSSWLGNGSPNSGVADGDSGTWIFTLTGSNLNTLTTQDFIDNTDMDGEFLLVRFRGIETGAGSDKVPAQVVPEASSLVLMSVAGVGLMGFFRNRRQGI